MAVASNEFVQNVKNVSQGANQLGNSYRQTAEALDLETKIATEHAQSLKGISSNAAVLNQTYSQFRKASKARLPTVSNSTKTY